MDTRVNPQTLDATIRKTLKTAEVCYGYSVFFGSEKIGSNVSGFMQAQADHPPLSGRPLFHYFQHQKIDNFVFYPTQLAPTDSTCYSLIDALRRCK